MTNVLTFRSDILVTSPFGKVYAARHGITRGIPGWFAERLSLPVGKTGL